MGGPVFQMFTFSKMDNSHYWDNFRKSLKIECFPNCTNHCQQYRSFLATLCRSFCIFVPSTCLNSVKIMKAALTVLLEISRSTGPISTKQIRSENLPCFSVSSNGFVFFEKICFGPKLPTNTSTLEIVKVRKKGDLNSPLSTTLREAHVPLTRRGQRRSHKSFAFY